MQPTQDNSTQQLRAIAGITAVIILFLHTYYYCYQALAGWGLTHPLIDRIVGGLARGGHLRHPTQTKILALAALAITTLGIQHPVPTKTIRRLITRTLTGTILYFLSDPLLDLDVPASNAAALYLVTTFTGLTLLYISIKAISSTLYWRHNNDIFNRINESFPQEERLLKNPYSINLKAQYTFRNQVRDSYINLVEIFRGTLVMGTPGSGKTRYIFRQLIQQSLANGMALFVYDLKYDDLTKLTYNTLEQIKKQPRPPGAPLLPTFYSINFTDFSRSHRLNAIPPESLEDISDAAECSRTILYALNKRWIQRQGDFFVESAVNFFTANIWFLRLYADGRYCTLPHLIELLQTPYNKLFSILQSYPSILTLVGSFVTAYGNGTMDQLQGQIDSAKIPLSALASPHIYYLLSANDFSLDLNNPQHPKVICIGSNPQKQFVYGAIVSLYVSQMVKLVNRKGGVPCHILLDEFPSFYAGGIDTTLAQARSNKVAITLGIQDLSQLRAAYGRDQADALFNLPGNLICSQVSGDSASLVSQRFGKIQQEKSTISTNSRDSSTSQSHQLDLAVPPSKISNLSSGEFVGITADNPNQKIQLKGFHCQVRIDQKAIQREEASYQPLPDIRPVTKDLEEYNFRQIKEEVLQMVEARLTYMQQTPALTPFIIAPNLGLNRRRQSPP